MRKHKRAGRSGCAILRNPISNVYLVNFLCCHAFYLTVAARRHDIPKNILLGLWRGHRTHRRNAGASYRWLLQCSWPRISCCSFQRLILGWGAKNAKIECSMEACLGMSYDICWPMLAGSCCTCSLRASKL